MREVRLCWFGHLRRRPEDAPVRRCETIECLGYRRSRGSPRKSWCEVIRHDLRTLGLVDDMAQDRKFWRDRIKVRGGHRSRTGPDRTGPAWTEDRFLFTPWTEDRTGLDRSRTDLVRNHAQECQQLGTGGPCHKARPCCRKKLARSDRADMHGRAAPA